MSDILEYPDNLVLHLERDRRSYKVFTTETKDKFKILGGLSDKDTIIDTKFMNIRDVKQLLVDSCINDYVIKSNLIFKQGFYGVVKELAKEREDKILADKSTQTELENL